MKQELFDYRDSLEFKYNHPLNTEPLQIDVVIIKKSRGITIDKNIARIFRADNILEYKSPGAYLAVNDFLKACAYANLYASITPGVDFADLTLTFVENRHPRKLLKYLTETRGYTAEETSPGIYLITGDYLPIQIIESGKLPERENLWLKSLVKGLPACKADSILEEIEKSGNKAQLGAYLYVLMTANMDAFLEAGNMARRNQKTFEEVLTRAGLIPEWIERGRAQGLEQGRAQGLEQGRAQGLEQGRVQGLEQGTLEIARKMKKAGKPLSEIEEFTGLPLDAIEKL
jgi:Uncharacterized conserved protein